MTCIDKQHETDQQDDEDDQETTAQTVTIRVVKNLAKDKACDKIRSKFKRINKSELINLKIYNIHLDYCWIEYVNEFVDRLNTLYFITTTSNEESQEVHQSLEQANQYGILQSKARFVDCINNDAIDASNENESSSNCEDNSIKSYSQGIDQPK